MTPYRLIHTPSGEVQTLEADSPLDLHLAITACTFSTCYDMEPPIPVRPLFSTRQELVRQIAGGAAVAVSGNWELHEGRHDNLRF